MNDKLLIRFSNIEDGNYITSYYTTNWSEALRMYSFIKENNLDYYLNTGYDNTVDEKYQNKELVIKDIAFQIGSTENLNVLDIVVEVL